MFHFVPDSNEAQGQPGPSNSQNLAMELQRAYQRIAELETALNNLINEWRQYPKEGFKGNNTFQSNPTPVVTTNQLWRNQVPPPRKFSGKDENYTIEQFRIQLELYFLNCGGIFQSDSQKVHFILSLLEGPALSYVTPYIGTLETDDEPVWFYAPELLFQELERVFGTPYKKRQDEYLLSKLRQEGDITKYVTQFKILSANIEWNEPALAFAFRNGLSNEIQDELARGEDPKNLKELMNKSIEIYQRFNSRRKEKSWRSFDFPKGKSTNKPQNQGSQGSSSSASKSSGPEPMELDAVKPKKLTKEEREQRIKDGVCLYCGKKGHFARECPAKKYRQSSTHAVRGDASRGLVHEERYRAMLDPERTKEILEKAGNIWLTPGPSEPKN